MHIAAVFILQAFLVPRALAAPPAAKAVPVPVGDVVPGALKCDQGAGYPVQLSFDDGPKDPQTGQVLDTLKLKGLKATFFISSSNFAHLMKTGKPNGTEKKLIALIARMKAEGHTIGSHSFEHIEHANLEHEGLEDVRTNMANNLKTLKLLGLGPPMPFRFPYGNGWFQDQNSRNQRQADYVMADVKGEGFVPTHWDIDSWDWSKIKRKALPKSMLKQICSHHGGIMLMHDIHQWSADNLPALIDSIQMSGHRIVTPTQFAQLNAELPPDRKYLSLADSVAGLYTCSRPIGDLDQVWRSCADYKQHSSDVNGTKGMQ